MAERPLGRLAGSVLALAGGATIAASFLDFSLWPIAWIAFVPILLALGTATTAWSAIGLGLAAGMATNVPAFFWLVHTIHVFGGFPLWLSLFFYLALSLYSSLQFVILALGLRRAGFGIAAIHPALLWVTLEFLFPSLFPWRLANSQRDVPILLQVGDLTGPFGLSFVMVWASAVGALWLRDGFRRARPAVALCVVAIAAVAGYGSVRLPAIDQAIAAAKKVRIGLVQGNLTIEEKEDVRYFEGNLANYRKLTEALEPAPDVVIWPETVITEALPRTLESLSPTGRSLLGLHHPLLTGAMTYDAYDRGERFFNSVMLFDGEGRVLGFSDKQILMPFGEYMPFGSVLPFLKALSPQTGDFQAGKEATPLEVPGVARFGPLNCYEDLKASIARRAVRDGRTDILFAVANDGWFGDTIAPFQHEALALWRAIENRRFLVRVTNTGVTDVVDPAGRVKLRLPGFAPASAVVEVARMSGETLYNRFGDWFGWSVTALALLALLFSVGWPAHSARPSRPELRG